MAKKNKPTDGLGPKEKEKIRAALRKVWNWSHARNLVKKRCEVKIDGETYYRCEASACTKVVPKIFVDHIEACGEVNGGIIKRMFVSSKKLQGLCNKCHKIKTRAERAVTKT